MALKDNRDGSNDRLKATIADLAARLVAEGETDYRAAALKAAKQLGLDRKALLPDAIEIDRALRCRQALFATESQPLALQALRAEALHVMRELDQFSPWLVGPVLTGTANEFSEIELELVGIEPKHFEMYLLGKGIEFDAADERRAPRHPSRTPAPIARYSLTWADLPIAIVLFEHHAARQALFPQGHLRHERVQRDEAMKRFESESKL